jgi:hypothetical protein
VHENTYFRTISYKTLLWQKNLKEYGLQSLTDIRKSPEIPSESLEGLECRNQRWCKSAKKIFVIHAQMHANFGMLGRER